MKIEFPKNFLWGSATASYQIEGHAPEDGRGKCVWDAMCGNPGMVAHGDTGFVTAGHASHMPEDVGIMKEIGLKAYRFSVSWPRIIPDGVGKLNSKGLDFYDRLVDELLYAGIDPFVTLFHWDYPHALFLKGGWLNPDSSDWFADYAEVVAGVLGDRVSHWCTLNEPECFLQLGHADGVHAPAIKYPWADVLTCTHNALLAHGKAVRVLRSVCESPIEVGIAHCAPTPFPAYIIEDDIEATKNAIYAVTRRDLWNGSWLADPIFFGEYPADGVKLFGKDMPEIGQGDMGIISQPVDFYGMNIYRGHAVSADGEAPRPLGKAISANHWDVTPECMYWATQLASRRFKKPIYILENGLCNTDWVHLDGKVHDPQRIDYTAQHLIELQRSIQHGADIRGYFHWSLMDNFEWAEGLRFRFGMVHVDFETQKRTLKDSALWYGKVISDNGFDF